MAYQAIFMGTLLSYGDVLATELSTDYAVTAVEEKGDEYLLSLVPRPGHEGYGKVQVAIGKMDLLPKRRSYYSLSGVLLKSCAFAVIDIQGGVLKTLKMDFDEPLKEAPDIVTIDNVKSLKSIPDRYYNESQLSYLGVSSGHARRCGQPARSLLLAGVDISPACGTRAGAARQVYNELAGQALRLDAPTNLDNVRGLNSPQYFIRGDVKLKPRRKG